MRCPGIPRGYPFMPKIVLRLERVVVGVGRRRVRRESSYANWRSLRGDIIGPKVRIVLELDG